MTIHAQKDLMLGKAQPFNIGKAKTGPAGPVTPPRLKSWWWMCRATHLNYSIHMGDDKLVFDLI